MLNRFPLSRFKLTYEASEMLREHPDWPAEQIDAELQKQLGVSADEAKTVVDRLQHAKREEDEQQAWHDRYLVPSGLLRETCFGPE